MTEAAQAKKEVSEVRRKFGSAGWDVSQESGCLAKLQQRREKESGWVDEKLKE